MSELFQAPPSRVEIRGESVTLRRAPWRANLAAIAFDLCLGSALFVTLLRVFRAPLFPDAATWMALACAVPGPWLFQKLYWKSTLGESVWGLSAAPKGRLRRLVPRCRIPSWNEGRALAATFLTGASLASAGLMVGFGLSGDPGVTAAEELRLTAFLPPTGVPSRPPADTATGTNVSAVSPDWLVAPFFYALGAWPTRFMGKPVFYQLPYQKGPPSRFVGQIIARWDMPETHLLIEGPKTPAGIPSRAQLEHCLRHSPLVAGADCWKLRQAALERPVRELRAQRLDPSGLSWFRVENPALPAADQAQGILLSAEDGQRRQDRFILVTAAGTHQAMVLDYPKGSRGDAARALLLQSIRSLRVADDLNPGRAWVDRSLASVRLTELQELANVAAGGGGSAAVVARLAEIQTLLIAKISVDPKAYDTYYHLGGTSLILARQVSKMDPRTRDEDLGVIAKPMIQTSYMYAQDIAPGDARTTELQGYWVEARKF